MIAGYDKNYRFIAYRDEALILMAPLFAGYNGLITSEDL